MNTERVFGLTKRVKRQMSARIAAHLSRMTNSSRPSGSDRCEAESLKTGGDEDSWHALTCAPGKDFK
jgi:hypothetical protein